jgi:ferredoxin-NADP reductase
MAGTAIPGRLSWALANVVQVVVETPRTKSLALDVPGWPGHRPGQHVDVRLTADDGYQAQRSYSVASAPGGERVELTVDRLEDGEVSPYLTDALRPGDQLELRGPIGGYFVWDPTDGGPLLLVGGGSGVAPLMAMLRHRAAIGSEVPATLLYSSRSWEEIIYRAELERLADDPQVRVLHTLTRSHPEGWTGYTRRIDRSMLADAAGSAPGGLAYVCGPTALVENVASELVVLGYPPQRVKTERFGPSGG